MNIWIAAADNRIDEVERILKTNPDCNVQDENGYTPMHAAAEYGHHELLKMLVSRGGNVNSTDVDGDTPLHACEDPKTAEFLLELGADIKAKNNEGITPLEKAESEGMPELAAFYRQKLGLADETLELLESQPLPENIKLSMQQEDELMTNVSDEQRQNLQQIVESGNVDDFKQFMQSVLQDAQDGDEGESIPAKKVSK